ncbi:MAG: hydrogen gas-evolving membrane-bound hydrogenase subunit E [Thermodesulfobacteriota bacterium]
MKRLALFVVILAGVLLAATAADFPRLGDTGSAPSRHVSPAYIQGSLDQTHTPNFVTSVLADYRGFDTMFETSVVFLAGMSCFFILRALRRKSLSEVYYYRHKPTGTVLAMLAPRRVPPRSSCFERIDADWTPQDLVVETMCLFMVPFIQIFALYVIAHGHYSPGGGFQGGVLLAASFLLVGLSRDLRTVERLLTEKKAILTAAAGVCVYAGTGLLALFFGGNFLDYGAFGPAFGAAIPAARSMGILCVEIGVAMTVMATLVTIYKLVSSRGTVEEGL